MLDWEQGLDNWYRLTSLDMSENRLQHLPKDMAGLVNLIELRLDHNELREIPK
jgi:Leucine-rich repeat (LRR) protein